MLFREDWIPGLDDLCYAFFHADDADLQLSRLLQSYGTRLFTKSGGFYAWSVGRQFNSERAVSAYPEVPVIGFPAPNDVCVCILWPPFGDVEIRSCVVETPNNVGTKSFPSYSRADSAIARSGQLFQMTAVSLLG